MLFRSRLLCGDSKLATARHCQTETAATTLGQMLSLEDLDEHECYQAMDWLFERQESSQKKLARKHLADGDPVLFDLSSSYFEGHTCPLARHGYSRDKRGDLPQVNYGIYCNAQGVPLGVKVLAGNENDHVAFPLAVERAFRSLKSIDLRVRPIHHRLADRVRSHIVLCMLAFYIEYQLRQVLAPLMFTDEDKLPAESRDSIVSPAPRSESAKRKDTTHRNEADVALSSFRDILQSLSAITRSEIIIAGHPKGRFTTTSRPTPYQQEIIRHLGMAHHL